MRSFIVFVALAAALFCTACSATGGNENDNENDPGEAFWVKLSLSDDVIAKYKVVRALIIDDEGAKIGESSGPFADGNGNNRFKITVPEKYAGTEQRFVVEFQRENSPLDSIVALRDYPIALGIMKAFYYQIPEPVPTSDEDESEDAPVPPVKPVVPAAGGELLLPLDGEIKTSDLQMGYGPKSIDILMNIPGLPNLYKIDLDLSDVTSYIAERYRTQFGVVTKISSDGEPDGLEIDITSSTLFNPNTVAGVCGGDDWYMVMNDSTIKEGDMVRIWVIFTKTNSMPRLFYKDVKLLEPFATMILKPKFAAIPIADESYFQLMLLADMGLPAPFNVLTADESYVLIKGGYDFSTTPELPVSLPGGISAPSLHPWNPYPTITIVPLSPVSTSDIFSNFSGRFDGAGYCIRNLDYSGPTGYNNNYGFFANTAGAEILNVNLEIKNAEGSVGSAYYLGGLVGWAGSRQVGAPLYTTVYTTINDVNITGSSSNMLDAHGSPNHVGGIAGLTNNTDTPDHGITGASQTVATNPYNFSP
jgi:hypothetical protein